MDHFAGEKRLGYAGGFKIPEEVIQKKLSHQTRKRDMSAEGQAENSRMQAELATKDDVLLGLELKQTRLASK